jgi:hypothetical protein
MEMNMNIQLSVRTILLIAGCFSAHFSLLSMEQEGHYLGGYDYNVSLDTSGASVGEMRQVERKTRNQEVLAEANAPELSAAERKYQAAQKTLHEIILRSTQETDALCDDAGDTQDDKTVLQACVDTILKHKREMVLVNLGIVR